MAHPPANLWRLTPNRAWTLDRPRFLAILNVTPDSFSDGGRLAGRDALLAAAWAAVSAGADGLDVGGESTRPGAGAVPADEQIRRVVPAVRAIRDELGADVAITVDSTRAEVARAALDAGADAINDVSAGLDDAGMFALAAERPCGIILMHRRMLPAEDVFSHQYKRAPEYADVVRSVAEFLAARAAAAITAGIPRESIVIDPGLGFGKSVEQNGELIERTDELTALGFPVLSGLSRKSFVTRLAGGGAVDLPPAERDAPSAVLSVHQVKRGARILRVHDVGVHAAALRAAGLMRDLTPRESRA